MANRNEESGREQSAYGRSGNPAEREQSRGQVAGDNPQWREPQASQQRYRQGVPQGAQQPYGEAGSGSSGQYNIGERGWGASQERESWESERGSDVYAGRGYAQGAQENLQGAPSGSQSAQGHGQLQGSQGYQRSPSYGQGEPGHGQGFEQPGYGQARQGSGQGGQQDWQRGMQQQLHGQQAGWQGFDPAQPGLREGSGMYGGKLGMPGGYGNPSQQFGYGGGLGYQGASGQRGFRGMGPKNYSRSDERIKEDVCEHLTQDDELDASEIEVKAEQGVVSLEGTVGERWMKHRAEDIAESCSGVREVENRIRVESTGKGRTGQESLGRSGSQDEGRRTSATLGSSGGSASTGKFPH